MVRGYVAGYNRYLADQAGKLPAACNGQPWVQPMTDGASFARLQELTMVQAGIVALADAMLAAQPPAAKTAAGSAEPSLSLADAAAAMREAGLLDSPLGSNAWAFGRGHHGQRQRAAAGQPALPLGRA